MTLRRTVVLLIGIVLALSLTPGVTMAEVGGPEGWSATSEVFAPGDFRAAPYLGNGRIGTMVPPSGGGFQDYGPDVRTSFPLEQPRYTGTYLAGFYARAALSWNNTQVIAALPSWSGLTIGVAGKEYRPDVDPATVQDYRQTMNFRTATVTTQASWQPEQGHRVDLRFDTFLSRARPDLAVQQVTITPRHTGEVAVTDAFDAATARRVIPVEAYADPARNQNTIGVRAEGTEDVAYLVSTVTAPEGARTESVPGGLRYSTAMTDGRAYRFVKYVGISSTDYGADPKGQAVRASEAGPVGGVDARSAEHVAAWDALWQPMVEIAGRDDYGRWIRTALYTVLASVREGERWSVQPTGLSSDDYGGLTFWDAETWIFPTLLALHPTLARTVVDFRAAALPTARANARGYGMPGALYPWDEGPGQRCASPGVCGLVEEHLHNEIALAQWQYFVATGDEQWLRERGAPVITGIAEYLSARVGPKLPDGKYHFAPAAGADEYVSLTIDNALTNGGVMHTMRIAAAAAQRAGLPADPRWADIQANMAMPPDIAPGVPAEYLGYRGAPIKQADTVLLSYPFSYAAQGYSPADTLRYYFDRTDPDGPNMSNAVGAILSARYDPCRTQEYLDRSVQPYVRAPFGFQSEARGDRAGANAIGQSAWVFVTGAGGFLQGLLYGPAGLRWTDTGAALDPMLPNGFPDGMTIRGLSVGDTRLTVHIGPEQTEVTVTSGPAVTLDTPLGQRHITSGAPLHLPTRPGC
ncbi:hypothetical protein [Nocardia sp. NPDC052566]|uniref:hypothetical protein n=1 Tax=Nocardia sp. NPDC052566 TaxID=3364330 RepID=UPI0037C7E8BB